jgi:hypothetical protein
MADFVDIEVIEREISGKYQGFENTAHVSVYSQDLGEIWPCFSKDESKNGTVILKTQVPKTWLMAFAPPKSEVLVKNLISGTCHTIANRILLIANENVDVRAAGGDIITVIAFGKYGIGLQDLKNELRDSFKEISANYEPEILEQTLSKLDSVNLELDDWINFIHSQIEKHHESLKQYDNFIEKLKFIPKENYENYLRAYINKREEIYNKYNLQNNWNQSQINEYRKEIVFACMGSIIDAIILEIKPQDNENVRKVLENIIGDTLKNYLKI